MSHRWVSICWLSWRHYAAASMTKKKTKTNIGTDFEVVQTLSKKVFRFPNFFGWQANVCNNTKIVQAFYWPSYQSLMTSLENLRSEKNNRFLNWNGLFSILNLNEWSKILWKSWIIVGITTLPFTLIHFLINILPIYIESL